MRAHGLLLAGLVVTVSGPLLAQDAIPSPSAVPDDSVLALVIDPIDYKGHDFVLLLDEGWLRIEEDGRTTETYRQVAQVVTADGAATWGDQSMTYNPRRERLRVDWMRVLDPSGTVVSAEPSHQQESSMPVAPEAPVYHDRRLVQSSLSGVVPGSIVDVAFTIETFDPVLPGDVRRNWSVNLLQPVRRSRYVVDVPEGQHIRTAAYNFPGTPLDVVENERRIRTWELRDVAAVELERFAGFPNSVIMGVQVGGPLAWTDIARWYADLSAGRYRLDPQIEAEHDRILGGAASREDSLRTTHRWVAQDFRYVSLALGEGSYQPRTPSDVFLSRFGDCKDKTTLFVALARRMGFDAYPVLAHSEGGVDSLMPSLGEFDHMIAAVAQDDRTTYLDLTSDLTPFDELPPNLHGQVALALPDNERAEVVVLPARPPEGNTLVQHVAGTIDAHGRFRGSVTFEATGTEQYGLRETFSGSASTAKADLDETLREFAESVMRGAVIESTEVFEGRDLRAPVRVTAWFAAPRVLETLGNQTVLPLPLMDFTDLSTLSAIRAETDRRFPIDVAAVNGPSIHRSSLEIVVPEGWGVEVLPDVDVDGAFGYYRGTYRGDGRTLLATREMGGHRGLVPPDSVHALIAWLEGVAQDRGGYFVVTTNGVVASDGAGASPLAGVVLNAADFGSGANLVSEGPMSEDNFVMLLSSPPDRSVERSFAASNMVFGVGESRFAFLAAAAGSFATHREAARSIQFMDLVDFPAVMSAMASELAGQDASVGAVRQVDLSSAGDVGTGWVMDFVTPIATFDLAVAMAARGRVATTITAVSPHRGLHDTDLVDLFAIMDDRVRANEGLLTDVTGTDDPAATLTADSSVALAAEGVPLDRIAAVAPAFPDTKRPTTSLVSARDLTTYTAEYEGTGFTFTRGGSNLVSVSTDAILATDPAHAIKQVLWSEDTDPTSQLLGVGTGDEWTSLFVGDELQPEFVEVTDLGSVSSALVVQARGAIRIDFIAVGFAVGRVAVKVLATAPPDEGRVEDVIEIARGAYARVLEYAADQASDDHPADLIDGVRRVLRAERDLARWVEAAAFDSAFAAGEALDTPGLVVAIDGATWNDLCWGGSLHGFAERALPACDAAVATDTTSWDHRDSRGLARALVGDRAGAIDDFAFVVDHVDDEAIRTERREWLDALREGENPFPPAVVAELRSMRW